MKKKILICLFAFVSLFLITGCSEKSGVAFKKDYEEVNGVANKSGKIHRVISIPEDNVFVEVTPEEVIKKIENKDSFYVYFGSRLCPWCRSVIEEANIMAKRHGVGKVYYVDIWDDEGNEILRDKYKLDDDNKPVLDKEGTESYKKFLTYFDSLLKEYTLTDSNGKTVSTNEKRIYAPNYILIEKGVAKKLVTGISEKQKDSREALTEEILKDEDTIFDDFFTEACDDAC